jgi:hypothetical protein
VVGVPVKKAVVMEGFGETQNTQLGFLMRIAVTRGAATGLDFKTPQCMFALNARKESQ